MERGKLVGSEMRPLRGMTGSSGDDIADLKLSSMSVAISVSGEGGGDKRHSARGIDVEGEMRSARGIGFCMGVVMIVRMMMGDESEGVIYSRWRMALGFCR